MLVNIEDILSKSWVETTFSSHRDQLEIDLNKIERPRALLEHFKFREFSSVQVYKDGLWKEELQSLQNITKKWTEKWTADELVKGLEERPLPGRRQKIPFLELVRDATVDHSKDYYLRTRYRWTHLAPADQSYIKKALDDFEACCKSERAQPTRQSKRLRALMERRHKGNRKFTKEKS